MSRRRRKTHLAPAPQQHRQGPVFSADAVALLTRKAEKKPLGNIFAPAKLPPWLATDAAIAQDDAITGYGDWAYNQASAFVGWNDFPAPVPMTTLAALVQRPEFWKISDIHAVEATRRWIKVTSVDDEDDKTDRIQAIEEALRRFNVRGAFREALRHDGHLGRGHVYLDLGTDNLATPIGAGADQISRNKVAKGALKGIRAIDPLWVFPQRYNSTDPLSPEWYRPQFWLVNGKQVHVSRLLSIVGRPVPDILKPAYTFGGLSLTQIAQPYVDNWIRTRQSVSDIVHSFSVFVLKTNLLTRDQTGSLAMNDGTSLLGRLMMFNDMRDNGGTMAIDKDGEDFANVSAPLGTIDSLQAQALENICSVANVPLVKYTGISPAGLNASSEGEVRVFYDTIHAHQENVLREPLQTVIDIIQLSEFGDIDPSIRFNFEPLWTMDEKEAAEVRQTEAATDAVYLDQGVLQPEEVRQRLATEEGSPYPGLDLSLELNVPDPGELEEPPVPESTSEAE